MRARRIAAQHGGATVEHAGLTALVALLLLAAISAFAAGAVLAQPAHPPKPEISKEELAKRQPTVINPPPTAKDWADIAKLPDWTGVWNPKVTDQDAQVKTNPPPWNETAE